MSGSVAGALGAAISGKTRDPASVLAALLWPLKPAQFFARVWEQRSLVIRRHCPSYYDAGGAVSSSSKSSSAPAAAAAAGHRALFSKQRFEEAVVRHQLQFGVHFNAMRYDKAGRRVNFGKRGHSPSRKELRRLWEQEGVTFQVMQPQQYEMECWRLNHALEASFGCLVGNNAYITPADTQGLAPHWDDIEVFALQLEGRKQWRLYEPVAPLQREYSPDFDQAQIGLPFLEPVLAAGDLLYFPRGTIHQAVGMAGQGGDGAAQFSHHLTVSTYQKHAWTDFLAQTLSEALDQATAEDVEFRRGLPVAFLNYMGAVHSDADLCSPAGRDLLLAQRAQFVDQARLLFGALSERLDFDAVADSVGSDFVAHRLPPPPECGGKDVPPEPKHQPEKAALGAGDVVDGDAEQPVQLASPENVALAAQITDLDCIVKLRVHPSHIRLVMEVTDEADEEDEDESSSDGDSKNDDDESENVQCTVVYSLDNRVDRNMDGRFAANPGVLRFPGQYSVALAALVCRHPEPVSLKELPMIKPSDCLTMARALCASGLLMFLPGKSAGVTRSKQDNKAKKKRQKTAKK